VIKWDAYSLKNWAAIWESQSDQGLTNSRWELYDVHFASAVGSPQRNFVKRALSEIARIERRRALHSVLREQLMTTRPDLSGDVLVDALVDIERMRLDLGGPGAFEDDFRGALEVAEARAETVRKERGAS
jgi:hypothetical protein